MQPFYFKNVRNGAAVLPSEIPKLPPAAVRSILRTLRENGLGTKVDANDPRAAEILSGIAVELVYLSLRRLEPNLTREQIDEQEDVDEVLRAFAVIQRANPRIFPLNAQAPRSEASDPLSSGQATPAPSTS